MTDLQKMFAMPPLTDDEIAVARLLAQFNLSAIGTEPGEVDTGTPGSSFGIRQTVGNAYVEWVKGEAKKTTELLRSGEDVASRKATVQLLALTSLLAGAMINFATSSFVRTKEEREKLLEVVFKDIRTRVNEAQSALDSVRALASTERTTNAT